MAIQSRLQDNNVMTEILTMVMVAARYVKSNLISFVSKLRASCLNVLAILASQQLNLHQIGAQFK